MTRMLIWSAVGVALLAAVVIALALAPKVAVLFIVAVGILALVIRVALWIGRRGSSDGESNATGDDRRAWRSDADLPARQSSSHGPWTLGILTRLDTLPAGGVLRRGCGLFGACCPESRVDLRPHGFAPARHHAHLQPLRNPDLRDSKGPAGLSGLPRSPNALRGPPAQLGERRRCTAEVRGSNPLRSTKPTAPADAGPTRCSRTSRTPTPATGRRRVAAGSSTPPAPAPPLTGARRPGGSRCAGRAGRPTP